MVDFPIYLLYDTGSQYSLRTRKYGICHEKKKNPHVTAGRHYLRHQRGFF